MENTKSQKLGSGIIIISIIHLISAILGVFGAAIVFFQKDSIINELQENGQKITSNTEITIGLILSVTLALAIILILLKKSIGIYCYFTIMMINIVYSIISTGFQWTLIFSLILPILMAIFINKKKKLFNV